MKREIDMCTEDEIAVQTSERLCCKYPGYYVIGETWLDIDTFGLVAVA